MNRFPSENSQSLSDTEAVVQQVVKEILERDFGKEYDSTGVEKRLGLRPIEGYQHVVDDYGLPCTAQEFFEKTIPLMKQR